MFTYVFAVYHSVGVAGLMALYPPSPPFTVVHCGLPLAELVAGEPLSCVPPSTVFWSVGWSENDTNCVSEPIVPFATDDAFKLSNPFVVPHVALSSLL